MARAKARAKAKGKPARARAARKAPRPRRAAAAKAKPKARPKQKFTVSHLREEDFQTGLREYAKYRDLGISKATGGMVQAHVIRLVPPCIPEEVSKLHYHDVDFQMVYVLKGWMKSEFEGQGPVLMREGTCWIQPPRIKHKVLDYSDDCEVLEIILPAEFETVTLE
jgi:mannose-6-phosphate isomerase-like protein (cupin superfamily)